MFSRSIIDDSRSVNDTSRIIRIMIVSDATTWSITDDCHSNNSRGVIYNHNIFVIQATGYINLFITVWQMLPLKRYQNVSCYLSKFITKDLFLNKNAFIFEHCKNVKTIKICSNKTFFI